MKNKKIVIFMIVLFVLAISGLMYIISRDDIVIEAYEATVNIDDAGNIEVNETFVIDFRTKYNERWRDVGYKKSSSNNPIYHGVDYDAYKSDTGTFISGEVIAVYKDGVDITNKVNIGYSYLGDLDRYGALILAEDSLNAESLYVDATDAGGLEGEMIFQYRYVLGGMVTKYNDISELNYRLFDYMEADIKKAYVSVYIDSDLSEFVEEDFYSYGHGNYSGEIVQTVVDKHNSTEPEYLITAKNINEGSYLEFRLLMPNAIFTNIALRNIVNLDMKEKIIDYEYLLYTETKIANIGAWVINILTVVSIALTVYLIIKAYKKYDKEHRAEFEGQYYRELPNESRTPAEMSYLYYFGKNIDEDVTATMLDLIRRKVLVLDLHNDNVTSDKPEFSVSFDKEVASKTALKSHEKVLINWFIGTIGDGNKVYLKDIEKFGSVSYNNAKIFEDYGHKFKDAVKNECKNYDFFDKGLARGKKQANLWGSSLIVILIISNIIGAILNVISTVNVIIMLVCIAVYYTYIGCIKRRSVAGNEEYVKWAAFKNFLVDFSSFEDYPIPGIIIWEEYLVYATSLKIADKVMEQLEVKLPEYEQEQATYMRTNYYGNYYHRRICFGYVNGSIRSGRQNAISTISIHNSSSGGGGRGGGFSRGSSFGGGGGGGRVR